MPLKVCIIGGSAAGASLGLALAQLNCQVTLIEARAMRESTPMGPSDRTLALSWASKKYLAQLGVWGPLAAQAQAIKEVQVSIQGQLGVARLQAEKYAVPALGYVLPLEQLEYQLITALKANSNVQFLSSTQLLSGQRQQQSWQITYATDKGAAQQLDCDLLVGADGQHSKVRCFNRIPSMVTPYAQYAIIGQITSTQALPQVALERFTQDGALAILPKGGQQYTFIWTVGVACYRAYMNLSDRDFLQSLQQQLGYRIGRLQSLQHKIALPLSGVKAQTQIGYHSLLVGNAAHYLHPIAAQGLNLTLRDIQYFSQLYQQRLPTTKQQLQSLLEDYERQRYPDQAILWSVTEILAQYISGDKLPGWLKALGIGGLESLPLLKKAFTQYAMGWRGN